MKTALDCLPCFIRQTLDAAKLADAPADVCETALRDIMRAAATMDLSAPPPVMAQQIHRHMRELLKNPDPYAKAKKRLNSFALSLYDELQTHICKSENPLKTAARLAIAGNIIDMGVKSNVNGDDVLASVKEALEKPLGGQAEAFCKAVNGAENILYLGDNAGEIVFDKLLIEQIGPQKVTYAVKSAPVINDGTMEDAKQTGMDELVRIIENGSDAPGTVLDDCSQAFLSCYNAADLVISKGQGNYESLCDENKNIFFLFKIKCDVVASHAGAPKGTQMLMQALNYRSSQGVT